MSAERDQHYANPPRAGIHLAAGDLAWLHVLLNASVPREQGGPMDWEGTGRRAAEAMLGFRAPCTCDPPRGDLPPAPGCPVHDPSGGGS